MLPYLTSGALLPGLAVQWVPVVAPNGWVSNPAPRAGDAQFYNPLLGVYVTVEQVSGASLSLVDRVIDYTAQVESKGKYDAVAADDNKAGVSLGLLQFNQRAGVLPALFAAMYAENPAKFTTMLGAGWANFLNEGWVRAADLKPFIPTLKSMAADVDFQRAQRKLAKTVFFDPVERKAREYGITSERGITMLFDAAVQRGLGNVSKALAAAYKPGMTTQDLLVQFATLIDSNPFAAGRRLDILRDRSLADEGGGDPATGWWRLKVVRPGGVLAGDVEMVRSVFVPQGKTVSAFSPSKGEVDAWIKLA